MKEKLKKIFWFIANPRLLFCVGIAWIITNGWSYILFAIGTIFEINWMIVVSTAYLTFLWFPFTPEKIVTFIIAIFLLKLLFPKDEKTLAILTNLFEKTKAAFKNRKNKSKKKDDNKNKDNV